MVIALGILMLIVAAGGATLVERLGFSAENMVGREIIIGETADAALTTPWFGTGFGTFQEAWPFFRPTGINAWFRQAHSTYVENLLELGIPAAIALFTTVFWLLAICARGLVVRRRNGLFPSLAISVAIVPIAHSTIDFSLQMPAVAFYLALWIGLGVAQAIPTETTNDPH